MALVLRTRVAVLTTTLTTTLLTNTGTNPIRVIKVLASCGNPGGSITLKKVDNSASLSVNIWNAKPIPANGNLQEFDEVLEAGDSLQGGFAGATDAHITINYAEET